MLVIVIHARQQGRRGRQGTVRRKRSKRVVRGMLRQNLNIREGQLHGQAQYIRPPFMESWVVSPPPRWSWFFVGSLYLVHIWFPELPLLIVSARGELGHQELKQFQKVKFQEFPSANCCSRQRSLSFPDPKAQEFGLLLLFFKREALELFNNPGSGSLPVKDSFNNTKHKWFFFVFIHLMPKKTNWLCYILKHIYIWNASEKIKPSSKDDFWLHEPQGVFFLDVRYVRSPWKIEDSNGFPPRHSKMVTCSSISLFGTFQQSTWKYQGSSKFQEYSYSYVQ